MFLLWQVGYTFLITVYALSFILFGYTFLLADSEGTGLNGRISRLLFVFVPQSISRLLSDSLDRKLYAELVAAYDYVLYKRNPIMQLV